MKNPPHEEVSDSRMKQSSNRLRLVLFLLTGVGLAVAVWLSFVVSGSAPTADTLIERSRAAMDQRDYSTAVDALEQALNLAPEQSEAWALLAEAAARKGDAAKSIDALERLVKLEPAKSGSLGVQLGRSWMTRSLIQPAIESLRLAGEAAPQASDPDRLLAQIFGVTGHRADVVKCLVRLIQKDAFTRDDLIVLSSVNPSIDDAGRLDQMLAADPSDKSPLLPRAMNALDRNQISEGERYLLEIVKSHPDDNEAQSILGEIYADFAPEKFLAWNSRLPRGGRRRWSDLVGARQMAEHSGKARPRDPLSA